MDRSRYLDLLRSDGAALRTAAARGLDAPVPPCPGWTVRDAVEHVAEVYEHKAAAIGLGGARPDPWPPEWPERDPLDWYDDAFARLLAALETAAPDAPSWTWWPEDQTAGFWVRRMAQETAVHRVDVESAFGTPSPVDAALAVDGVDEVLTMMLSGDWAEEPHPELTGTALVRAGERSWHVTMEAAEVGVREGEGPADVTVTGDPSPLLLWLWGRAPDEAVTFDGDAEAFGRLRRRLARATQ
jgi:uncharacterized protein (TIGR03083 family)